MTLYTLQAYCAEHATTEQRAAGVVQARSFILVHPETAGQRSIEVALPLACIDEPAISKTIVMIRQYRRLHEGRHEYGAAVELSVAPR